MTDSPDGPNDDGSGSSDRNGTPSRENERRSRRETDTRLREVVTARGHEHVTANHGSTFEVTTDDFLTPAGDCILAIGADRAPAEFDPDFVEACQDENATITITVETDERSQSVRGRGHPDLEFSNDRSAVGRTSTYVDDRTVVIDAEFAADGFDRDLIAELADGADVRVTFEVERP